MPPASRLSDPAKLGSAKLGSAKPGSAKPGATKLGAARLDPARDAARLLGWSGLTILMVGAPLLSVVSRRALLVLLPIGACVLLAAVLVTISREGLGTLRAAARRPVGIAALLLAGWMGFSIVWTPFPAVAIPHYAATLVLAALATLVTAYLPEGRARPTLYLLPAGVAATALSILAMVFFGPADYRGGSEFDPSLLERSVLTIVVLAWPALGALAAFGRWLLAIALAVLVADVVILAQTPLAMAAFALGALAFAATGGAPRRIALVAAVVFAGLVVIAPLLPFGLAPLSAKIATVGRSTVAAMADWRSLVAEDPVRLITGHGLDLARYGVFIGYLPAHTPRSILFELWYDLGLLGAGAFAAIIVFGLRAAASTGPNVAPALVGGIVATLSIATLGIATAELWFVTLAGLQAIAFGLLTRSSRGDRPAVASLEAMPDPVADGPGTAVAVASRI